MNIFELLAKNLSDDKFEKELVALIQSGENINAIRLGNTALDTAKFMMISKVVILKKYGAKTAKDLGVKPLGVHDKAVSGVPADGLEELHETVKKFDYDTKGSLVVVDDYLSNSDQAGAAEEQDGNVINLRALLPKMRNHFAQLCFEEESIGTVVFLNPELVLISRHCLNGEVLRNLNIRIFNHEPFKIKGIIEDDAECMLDYAILLIEGKNPNIKDRIKLSSNRKPLLSLFVGFDMDDNFCFATFNGDQDVYESVAKMQISYQQTSAGLSGAVYFDEEAGLYAIHQNTGFETKESTFISAITDKNSTSILSSILARKEINCKYSECDGNPFPHFSVSDGVHYDEGNARSATLGKNPNIAKDELGGAGNLVCKEVLLRWALQTADGKTPKARYVGKEKDAKKWIYDWENWEVKVRKTNGGEREWVELSKKEGTKLVIQMGHKLSAVSYWVYGYDLVNNVILKKYMDSYNGNVTKEVKVARYNNRYAMYNVPGFKRVEDRQAQINRFFMYDASNYRFEYGELNETNGREEKKYCTFDDIFSKGATVGDVDEDTADRLKKYRALRNDTATSKVVTPTLFARAKALDERIEQNVENIARCKK